MRVYNREEFLKLPEGTVFCKGVRWAWDTICVKEKTLKNDFFNDFFYLDLCSLEAESSDSLEDSLKNGTSYPMNQSYMRDGCFNDEDLFLVFENDDLSKITELFAQSMLVRVKNEMDHGRVKLSEKDV